MQILGQAQRVDLVAVAHDPQVLSVAFEAGLASCYATESTPGSQQRGFFSWDATAKWIPIGGSCGV